MKPSSRSRIERPILPSFKRCPKDERQSPSPKFLSKGMPFSREEDNCILSPPTTDPSLWPSIKLKRLLKYPYTRPYTSTDKPHIEHLNALIRQYIPKGSSFINITHKQFSNIQNKLNHRPRKKLEYRTPFEGFFLNLP